MAIQDKLLHWKSLCLLSLGFYLVALILPAIEYNPFIGDCYGFMSGKTRKWWPSGEVYNGASLLLGGFIAIVFLKSETVGWLPNPLYIVGYIALICHSGSYIKYLLLSALVLAAVSLFIPYWFGGFDNGVESCPYSILTPLAGYWFWLAAIFLMLISAIRKK